MITLIVSSINGSVLDTYNRALTDEERAAYELTFSHVEIIEVFDAPFPIDAVELEAA